MREHAILGGRRRARAIAWAAAAVLTGTSSLFVLGATSQAETPHQLRLGATVQGGNPSLVTAREASIGRSLDVVRVFKSWDDPFPTADDLALLDGRDIILSIKPDRGNTELRWADIAAAQPGDPLYADMVSWAQRLAPYEANVDITFHHEPEAASNTPHGNAGEFVAAWRRFMDVTSASGLDATRVWIMTAYSFGLASSDRRYAPKWYPGDQWVDAIASDAYNWFDCRNGISSSWKSLEDIIEPMRQFGLQHPDERLMVTEVGSVEDSSNPKRKANFIDDVRALFARPGYERFDTLSWFDLDRQGGGKNCDWRVSSSTAALDAFRSLAGDPLYGGTDGGATTTTTSSTSTTTGPTTTGPTTTGPTTTTTAPPPSSGCTLVVDGATATLTWAATGGTDIVRRNGSWLTTAPPTATSYVDAASPPGATYLIRTWRNGVRNDVDCLPGSTTTTTTTSSTTSTTSSTTSTTTTTTTLPSDGCRATRVSSSTVVLDWVDAGGTHVVRRDGAWLSTPGYGVDTYTDGAAPAGAVYVIRTWFGGSRVDTPCA